MKLDDEEIIAAYLTNSTLSDAARALGTSKQLVSQTIYKLAALGVNVPVTKVTDKTDGRSVTTRYPAERISELNEFVARYDLGKTK